MTWTYIWTQHIMPRPHHHGGDRPHNLKRCITKETVLTIQSLVFNIIDYQIRQS